MTEENVHQEDENLEEDQTSESENEDASADDTAERLKKAEEIAAKLKGESK